MDLKHWISVGLVIVSTLFAPLTPHLARFLVKRYGGLKTPPREKVWKVLSLFCLLAALALDLVVLVDQTSQPIQRSNQIIIALTTIAAALQVVATLQVFERRPRTDVQSLPEVLDKYKKELISR